MIRSNLPIPFLYRLRLNAGAAARRAAMSASTRPVRQAAPRRAPAGSAGQLWQDFIDRYESFTGVLCAAAKSGCDDGRESEYALLRRWFVANYYRISGRLRPVLDAEFAHEVISAPLIADYAGQKRALDPLEALFLPATLGDVLAHDTGDLIPRVVRISTAVYRCYEDWEAAQTN
jgi:hypothetical protein